MTSFPSNGSSSEWPLPIGDVLRIDTEFVGVALGRYLLVEQRLANAGSGNPKTRHPVDGINCQAEPVCLILDSQFQWRIDVPLLLVTTHVDVVLTGPPVGKPVNQPWIGMKVEDDRLVWSKDGLELPIRHSMRVFGARHQFEKVHNVNEPHFHVG